MEHFEYRLFRYQISKIPAVRPPNRLTDRISLRTMRPPPPQTDAEATVAWPKVLAALKEKNERVSCNTTRGRAKDDERTLAARDPAHTLLVWPRHTAWVGGAVSIPGLLKPSSNVFNGLHPVRYPWRMGGTGCLALRFRIRPLPRVDTRFEFS